MKKRFGPKSLIPVGIGLLTFSAFVGSVSGSLAWWAYSTRASVSYQGTSVTTAEQLQIGLKISKANFDTEDKINALTALGLFEEPELATANYRYFFTNAGGGLSSTVVKTYLQTENVYSVNELAPISSRYYSSGPLFGDTYYNEETGKTMILKDNWVEIEHVATEGELPATATNGVSMMVDATSKIMKYNGIEWSESSLTGTVATAGDLPTNTEFHLYDTLEARNPLNTEIAPTKKYVRIPFVFRIVKINSTGVDDRYAAGRPIFIENIDASASSINPTAQIGKGIRLYFNNGTLNNRIIVNPGDETTTNVADMRTIVAGALDLNNDGYYDRYVTGPNIGDEIIYGDYSGTATNTFENDVDPTTLSNINEIADAGDLEDLENSHTTFLARHAPDSLCYNDYSGLTRRYAEYRTANSLKTTYSRGRLSGGLPMCVTGDASKHFLAELDTTIWLEGWDHAVIDREIKHEFNLGLTFEIDNA